MDGMLVMSAYIKSGVLLNTARQNIETMRWT